MCVSQIIDKTEGAVSCLGARFSDSHTTVDEVHVVEADDPAIVTCMVTYAMIWRDQPTTVQAPTSFALLRQDRSWNIALLHTK